MNRGKVRGGAAVAALMSMGMVAAASGDLLAGWHFNGLSSPVGAEIAASQGTGTLDLSEFGGSGLQWQTGSALNAWGSNPAGEALGVTGTAANGKSAVLLIPTEGYSGLTLSLAARATATGHMASVVEAWNGSQWVGAGSFSLSPTVWSIQSFDLSSMSFLDDGLAKLRIRFEGASSGQGNFRVDNLRLEGVAIPAPGAILMTGAALLTTSRGRRRRR